MEVQCYTYKGSKLAGSNALSRILNNAASLQLFEANLTMNAYFEHEDNNEDVNHDDHEGTSISEMLAFYRIDIGINEGEIIDQDNSPDLLLASFGYSTASITWDQIKRLTRDDVTSKTLTNWITTGCPGP